MMHFHQHTGFHFNVEFQGISAEINDVPFKNITGLTIDIEEHLLASENQSVFKHRFPERSRFPNLILEGGKVSDSELIDWCQTPLANQTNSPKDLVVQLLNDDKEILVAWNVVHALPVKCRNLPAHSNENELIIDTIELAYNYFTLI